MIFLLFFHATPSSLLLRQDGSDSQHGTAVSFFEGSFLAAMSASSDPKDRTEGRKLLLLWLHEKAPAAWRAAFGQKIL